MYAFVCVIVCAWCKESPKTDCFFLWFYGELYSTTPGNYGTGLFTISESWSFVEHAIGRYGNLTVAGVTHFQDPFMLYIHKSTNRYIYKSIHHNVSLLWWILDTLFSPKRQLEPFISKDGFSDRCALSKLQTFRKSTIETVWNWCPPGVIAS